MPTGAGELRGVIVQNGVRRWGRRVELKVQALRGEVDGFVRTESIRRWKALLGARQPRFSAVSKLHSIQIERS